MSSRYDEDIEALLTQYHAERERALDTRRRIKETTATVTAPRQAVKVTVNAQGDVVEIEFPTGAYRRMAPKELAGVLSDAIKEARAKALDGVDRLITDRLPAGVSISGLLQGRVEAGDLLPEAPGLPEPVRDYLDRGSPTGI